MSQAPSMPVFTDALIGDTLHLNAEEFGAYCLLLFATWRNNGEALSDNAAELAQICRVTPARWRSHMRPKLVRFFDISDGCWHQKRLEREWDNVQKKIEANRANGARGGRPKEPNKNPPVIPPKTHGEPNDNPQQTERQSTQSQSQSQKLASKLIPDSLPKDWAELAAADRAKAELPEVDLQHEWGRFINKIDAEPTIERWIGWALKARAAGTNPRAKAADHIAEPPWQARCRSWANGKRWDPLWGPPPDDAGCFAPRVEIDQAVMRKANGATNLTERTPA